ncbi:hypothetical protein [Halorubrum sodomense]|uniref:hypothetical protein n=1 Tax=Halorubrum sodomense TaxID=35743 RepID=UPI000B851221|nr:hypothetical protein [Halorubrum sodomense]
MSQASTSSGGSDDGYTLPETLQRLSKSPQGFILGAILAPLIRGLENIVLRLLETLTFVFQGSAPGLIGTYGLADIPLYIGTQLVNVGSIIGGSAAGGTGILGLINRLVEAGLAFATAGGPLAPIIVAGELVVVVYVIVVVARRIILVIADAVPGLAGVLGT